MKSRAACCMALIGRSGRPATPAERLSLDPAGQEHILQQEDGKHGSCKWWRTCPAHSPFVPRVMRRLKLRDDIAFFQAIKAATGKNFQRVNRKSPEQLTHAIRQLVSKAIL
jgi:type I restriction enzyme R subunit